jgi:hypothetical protein
MQELMSVISERMRESEAGDNFTIAEALAKCFSDWVGGAVAVWS